MSELHELCYLKTRPITKEVHLATLKSYLKDGIPATYTLEEAYNYENDIETDELKSTTTPLHLLCESIPTPGSEDALNEAEELVVLEMISELFLNGAGWCLVNDKDETPGCILLRRGLQKSKFWDSIVDAGVRAEMLLRRLNDPNVEFLSDDEVEGLEAYEAQEAEQASKDEVSENKEENEEEIPELVDEDLIKKAEALKQELINDPSNTTATYLKTKLEYKDGALITEERGDGVMMQWEDQLMKAGCDSLFSSIEDPKEVNILNIGFGMGIIDTMIQANKPTKHYICEAHPDVLNKIEADGWLKKDGVVVLRGKWQDTLPQLLSEGVFFDGIYFDTYSEHYTDMLELFDLLVGLLKPEGTFSFFNGLGADRLICYEVYKQVVELDLENYGLAIKYSELAAPVSTLVENDENDDSVWKGIKRAYWRCPIYYHPEARFA
ncbi:hypothetical protein CANARDRAFT_29231 [[Candida] arabinofermentans NRRL YB-2248]|uniref:Arginine N-methyltransferase 2 n=1 Tax=[Candida] arabinofermentans NRRL YB-2248 TaxID=983967 RepID=A0A1E4SXZ4_9ASCO|nr:hypothetical protein CANARDRAFT_29231 [[Candida] arabinofermentans NRRL YB-2248]